VIEFRTDPQTERGDAIRPLASLLISLDRRRRQSDL
jgi:hypothetical protein